MAEVKYKFPKSIGQCADKLYNLKEARLKAAKVVEAMEAEERALKEHIILTLPKSEASGVAGKVARVTIVTKLIPQVKDWELFYKYVKKTGSFDLLQRRLTDTAIKERWEAGKQVPGVESFNALTVSINKI